jgi:L-alanine-DL-glutamate epimerase-like enolase superfamily enzyme
VRATPEALADALARLSFVIEGAAVASGECTVPSYPWGPRPTSVITLAGGGVAGRGEHVGWTAEAHATFRTTALPMSRGTVGEFVAALRAAGAPPYDRAALEAAVIDLALRQRGVDLFDLVGAARAPVRYVESFARRPDAAAHARRLRAAAPAIALKVDVDPAWDARVLEELAAVGGIAVLDFKTSGAAADHEHAHRCCPAALIEDPAPAAGPWSASLRQRLAADASVTSAADIDRLPIRPAAVNLKPARMGGALETLAAAARCAALGVAVYMGGMFEVGPGRLQVQTLAALLCPDAPNDVAPIALSDRPAPRPARLVLDARPGFGADDRS